MRGENTSGSWGGSKMPNKRRQYPIPKFENLAEEDRFWQSHSPLMEGYEGKVQKKKQNRSSFLSVRLTGEELAQLRVKATQYGLGPSTYARQALIRDLESDAGSLPPELLFHFCRLQYSNLTEQQREKYFKKLTAVYEEYQKEYQKAQSELARQMMGVVPWDYAPGPVKEAVGEEAD
jgi:hypothetical protein